MWAHNNWWGAVWRFIRYRNCGIPYNVNQQASTNYEEINCNKKPQYAYLLCTPKCSSKSNGDKQEKNGSKSSQKRHQCPIQDQNICSFLEYVGWGSAIFIGVQYVIQKYIPRNISEDSLPKQISLKNFLIRLPLGSNLQLEPAKLRVLPDQPSTQLSLTTCLKDNVRSLETLQFDSVDFKFDEEVQKNELEKENISVPETKDIDVTVLANKYISGMQNRIGVHLAENNYSEKALDYFEASCQLGDNEACFNAGVCYETGCGTQMNLEKAREFYTKAADLGHPKAIYNLGVFYIGSDVDSDYQKGIDLLEKAADMGVIEAQKYLGIHCLETEEMDKAVSFLTSAVKNKDVDSQYYLGLCYEYGWGIEENLALAADMYSKASHAGHLDATYNLGVFHELGLGGIPENSTAAIELFKQAAEAGHEESKQRLKSSLNFKRISNSFSLPDINGIITATSRLNKSWSEDVNKLQKYFLVPKSSRKMSGKNFLLTFQDNTDSEFLSNVWSSMPASVCDV